MLIGAVVFALVVLGTSFPIGGLLSQRSAISGTAHELSTVTSENQSLARQVADLSSPSAINELAREDYGFVPKGQRVYDILPASSPSGSAPSPGVLPLDGPPVVPGSARSKALIGIEASIGAASALRPGQGARPKDSSIDGDTPAPPEPHSYWGRVVQTLEFWN